MTASTARTMRGGYVRPQTLPKGANGRSLCRWCGLEVPKRRRTFCSDWCVNEWRLRTDPGYLRERVFERDKGVCARCGVNTEAERLRIRRLPRSKRFAALKEWGIRRAGRSSLWDADHIVPVSEGGGECDLSNLRTLCLECHRKVTAELHTRAAGKRQSRLAAPAAAQHAIVLG